LNQSRPRAHLPNRVDPFGALFATPARGLFFGNRGGRFHDPSTLSVPGRAYASRQWICCLLAFKGRRKPVWGKAFTDLFFMDEVTALAAGHRPCFECRRTDAVAFARAWNAQRPPRAPEMDAVLHAQRLDGRTKRRHVLALESLPDAAMIERDGLALAVRGSRLLRWTAQGYAAVLPRAGGLVPVLTPPAILQVLTAGYRPLWHPSAE
jgi:hypothetical protein